MRQNKDDVLRTQRRANEHLVLAALRLEELADSARGALMEASAAYAIVRGTELIIELANPAILKMWGRTEAIIGKPLLEAMPELRGQGFDGLMFEVMRTGVPFLANEIAARLVRNGKLGTLYFNVGYSPVRNALNEIDGISIIAFDVTPQAVAKTLLALGARVGRALVAEGCLGEHLEECCAALVDFGAATARIWTYNSSHEVLEIRASAGLRTHFDEAQVRVALGAGKIGRIARSLEPIVTNAVVGHPQVLDQAWAEQEGIVSFAGYPLVVGDRLLGVMALFAKEELSADQISALSSVANQIALGIDRDDNERFRELFLGILGHDLRNPLNAISMGAQMLASQPGLSAPHLRTVELLRKSASRMGRMITQVLDFTRARAGGGIPIKRQAADLQAICAQTIEELSSANPGRVIETTYAGDAHGEWDVDRLAQIFSNLVGNALKHGKRDAPVLVHVDATGDVVRCAVRNCGAPIPPALLPRLFDPFRQGHVGSSAGADGLGLGLFIAQQIAVAHGGRICVRSSEEEGTELSFELPRTPISR